MNEPGKTNGELPKNMKLTPPNTSASRWRWAERDQLAAEMPN